MKTVVQGGKSVYGASVGILMLEARFPRIPGDMGNATTWPFPVHYRVVRDASPERVVTQKARGLLGRFIDAGQDLVRHGADGITTNCGFLSIYQPELASALGVPVATSSLMQVPLVQATLPPGKRVGVLTISAETMTPEHLTRIGVDATTPVGGVDPAGEFFTKIIGNAPDLDVEKCRAENVAGALALQQAHPDLGAIVLECTNMIPYAADVRRATGLPTYSILSFITWFQSSLVPRRFDLAAF